MKHLVASSLEPTECREGEIVLFGPPCADANCSALTSMVGVQTGETATTFRVVEMLSLQDLAKRIEYHLIELYPNENATELHHAANVQAVGLQRLLEEFPQHTVLRMAADGTFSPVGTELPDPRRSLSFTDHDCNPPPPEPVVAPPPPQKPWWKFWSR